MTFTKEDGLVQRLALLNQEITVYLNHMLASPHINATNYFYLLKLLDYPEITQSKFSTLVKLNQSTITRAINALVKNGYIEKLNSEDKRSALLRLTPLGKKTALSIKEKVGKLNQFLLPNQEDGQMIQLLEKIETQLNQLEKNK
ncbi:MarR family winged helix-turn-helix transcriptional regulator [Enterococcus dongliensis]|uniref:MarR family winged helix-turn-helix transcriptional regulator n=1 Tax=Enterococcus dongliensis TaxID=2559925 RepID=UPI00288E1966|nr:MarR family transcriptional regulator [Enterococcus dongliensis]MDT2612496.1 MarR family transcriptional regulator [Enterococcus dongliensis]